MEETANSKNKRFVQEIDVLDIHLYVYITKRILHARCGYEF